MITLSKSNFSKVERLLYHSPTFAYAVLEQCIPGCVYTTEDESTFLIGTNSGIYYVIGDKENILFNHSLLEFFRKSIVEKARFTLFSPSEKWDQVLTECFKQESIMLRRYSFTFNQQIYLENKVNLSEEFTIQKIDEEMINTSIEFNEDYYKEYWGSVANFLQNGFGFCILHNGDVVSECTSIFKTQQYAEIDIATNANFRGKGLAQAVAQVFIDHCIANNIIPRWDCSTDNLASIRLGEKMGFENLKEYSVFIKAGN